jgi:hypothetical protein
VLFRYALLDNREGPGGVKAMTRSEFIGAITRLVRNWKDPGGVPRAELAAIYDEVRNSTAHELAEAQRKLDTALGKYHKELTRSK